MTVVVSLPFRFPGTSLPLAPEDRFSLDRLQGFTRFRMPAGATVIAMADGLLSIRTAAADAGAALVLRPLMPHRLAERLPDRFATLRLLGIEQILYTGLDLSAVAETATWADAARHVRRRTVTRTVRGLRPVDPRAFLEGGAVVRVARGDRLFHDVSAANDFEVAVGLTTGPDPYLGDVMVLLALWQDAGLLAGDPAVPEGLLVASPTRLPVLGPRTGNAGQRLDCPETHVLLRRPPSDGGVLPSELARIGVGVTTPLRLTMDPVGEPGRYVGELRERPGTRVLALSPDAEDPLRLTFDPLSWSALPADMQQRRSVEVDVFREPGASVARFGIRAFQPPPDPRGQGTIEPRHPEQWRGPDLTGRYEQPSATPAWAAWALQVHQAGVHVEVWIQPRAAFRRLHLAGDTTSREELPVTFLLTGRQLMPAGVPGQPPRPEDALSAQLQFTPTGTGMSAVLTMGPERIDFQRVSTTPRFSDEVLAAIRSEDVRLFATAHERSPLTTAQESAGDALVQRLVQLLTEYFTQRTDRNVQNRVAVQVNDLLREWFERMTDAGLEPRPPPAHREQWVLARHLIVTRLANRRLTFDVPSGLGTEPVHASAATWLRVLLDQQQGDTSNARQHLDLPVGGPGEEFHYRWKFVGLLGPEGSVGWFGASGRVGVMRIQRVRPLDTAGERVDIVWTQDYKVAVVSVSTGRSVGDSRGESDASWNSLTSWVEWTQSDFPGPFSIVAGSYAHDVEGVTPPGLGTAVFIGSGSRRNVLGGPADGASLNYGLQGGAQIQARFGLLFDVGVTPSAPADGFADLFAPQAEAPLRLSIPLDFETAEARLTLEGWASLRSFTAMQLAGMRNSATEITVTGWASLLGSGLDNQVLSERRAENVRRAMEDILGPPPRARIVEVAAQGEQNAQGPGPDEPGDRTVSVAMNGRQVVRLD